MKIDRRMLVEFEIGIMDLADEFKVENAEELSRFSSMLHESMEGAILDYAFDQHWDEDYEAQY